MPVKFASRRILQLPLPALFIASHTAAETVDITNSVLSSRAVDCGAHTGSYVAMAFDHVNDRQMQGTLQIEASNDHCTFTVNQIPNHDFGQNARWPHKPAPNHDQLTIPRNPKVATSTTMLGLSPGAILLNGVKWEPNPAACFGVGRDRPGNERIGCGPAFIDHPWRYNVGAALNKFSFDDYHAHVQKGGLYHYHATPRVLYSVNGQLLDNADCKAIGESPVIGFALDGFPLYGPCIKDNSGTTRLARSSYALKTGLREDIDGYTTPYVAGIVASSDYNGQFVGDYEFIEGSGDLDECNGTTVDGQYGYYATNNFPYAIKCLKGTALIPIR